MLLISLGWGVETAAGVERSEVGSEAKAMADGGAGSAENSGERMDVEHESVFKIGYGGTWNVDPYQSPLLYSGQEIRMGGEIAQPFRKIANTEKGGWAHMGRFSVTGSRAYTATKNNRTYGLGVEGGWSAYHHWDWQTGATPGLKDSKLQVWLGPELNADIMARQQASEVNKPFSVDVGVDAMAMVGLSYTMYAQKTRYRMRYLLDINILGVEFMPDYWESYYEVYKNRLKGNIHCSGPWNRNRIRQEWCMDFGFKRSTWRLGVEHEWLRYGGKEMTWVRQQVGVVVGCVWQYRTSRAM